MHKTKILAIIVIAIFISGCLGQNTEQTKEEKTAKDGDEVKVDYTGYIGIWNETTKKYDKGEIFDTSLWDIANNTNLTKTKDFEKRKKEDYRPLSFTIGSGQMIKGFNDGVKGMKINENKSVVIQPEDGYGGFNWTYVDNTTKLYLEVNVTEVMNKTEFQELVNESANEGIKFTHPNYGWNSTVYKVEGENVIIKNLPYEDDWKYFINETNGQSYNRTIQIKGFEWNSTVISINETIIKVKHIPEIGMKVLFKGRNGKVYSINDNKNETNATISIDLNNPLVDKVLIFDITLIVILPKKPTLG